VLFFIQANRTVTWASHSVGRSLHTKRVGAIEVTEYAFGIDVSQRKLDTALLEVQVDVRETVERLAANQILVHCLALGGVDLTSPAGKMTMQVIAAAAEFERDLLIERTKAGSAGPGPRASALGGLPV